MEDGSVINLLFRRVLNARKLWDSPIFGRNIDIELSHYQATVKNAERLVLGVMCIYFIIVVKVTMGEFQWLHQLLARYGTFHQRRHNLKMTKSLRCSMTDMSPERYI